VSPAKLGFFVRAVRYFLEAQVGLGLFRNCAFERLDLFRLFVLYAEHVFWGSVDAVLEFRLSRSRLRVRTALIGGRFWRLLRFDRFALSRIWNFLGRFLDRLF